MCEYLPFHISGLIMLQTTNSMFNDSLLKDVTPQSLLAWHRVRLANVMAHNGKEWGEVYKQYNSGIEIISCFLKNLVVRGAGA